MYICKLRMQYGMNLVQVTNIGYWQNFGIFRLVSRVRQVSLRIIAELSPPNKVPSPPKLKNE